MKSQLLLFLGRFSSRPQRKALFSYLTWLPVIWACGWQDICARCFFVYGVLVFLKIPVAYSRLVNRLGVSPLWLYIWRLFFFSFPVTCCTNVWIILLLRSSLFVVSFLFTKMSHVLLCGVSGGRKILLSLGIIKCFLYFLALSEPHLFLASACLLLKMLTGVVENFCLSLP